MLQIIIIIFIFFFFSTCVYSIIDHFGCRISLQINKEFNNSDQFFIYLRAELNSQLLLLLLLLLLAAAWKNLVLMYKFCLS
jgi:hypothetical protein